MKDTDKNVKMDELDNYTDGEVLDWLFDLAGVTTVEELENILIKKIETAKWNKEHHPTTEGKQGWTDIEKSAREELLTRRSKK